MPLDSPFDDVYRLGIKEAAASLDIERLDIERLLQAPVSIPDHALIAPERAAPQGSIEEYIALRISA